MTDTPGVPRPAPVPTDAGGWSRSRRVRWAVPAVGAVVVVAALLLPMVASASPKLRPRSPAELLAAVGGAGATPLSGTVVETARLGLPALPQGEGTAISPTALVTGSHTIRVWYDGGERARLALVGDLAETDLIRNGTDAWLWTSGKNTAQHLTLDPAKTASEPIPTTPDALTPQAAAAKALAAVDPTTKVTLGPTTKVAGRAAYQLVLAPRDQRSLVGQVRIAVDADTSVPLRVQIYAAGPTGRPAFETGFSSVSFKKPAAAVFRFSPPRGAKVSNLTPGARPDGSKDDATTDAAPTMRGRATKDHQAADRVHVTGSGWTSVVELATGPTAPPAPGKRQEGSTADQQLRAVMQAMSPVSGAFGSGRLLRTKLLSVLLLDDGRLFVGAVRPELLLAQAAAAT